MDTRVDPPSIISISAKEPHWILMVDFTLGTHPITTKGTTELGRSEATKRFWCCLH